MSEETFPNPRRVLHLVINHFPAATLEKVVLSSPGTNDITEIFPLTESNAREALGKIFAADTVAVWGEVEWDNGYRPPLH